MVRLFDKVKKKSDGSLHTVIVTSERFTTSEYKMGSRDKFKVMVYTLKAEDGTISEYTREEMNRLFEVVVESRSIKRFKDYIVKLDSIILDITKDLGVTDELVKSIVKVLVINGLMNVVDITSEDGFDGYYDIIVRDSTRMVRFNISPIGNVYSIKFFTIDNKGVFRIDKRGKVI